MTGHSSIVTDHSSIVTADSGHQGNSVTFARNRRSRSSGIIGHVRPESAVTLARNTHYSLMLTCRACGVDPHAYLLHVLTELPQRAPDADISDLLPFNFARQQAVTG